MPTRTRPLLVWCSAAILAAGCTHSVDGRATRPPPRPYEGSSSPIEIDTVMLSKSQMQGITGGGDDLTIVPSMDVKTPVDIELLAKSVPPQCQWLFDETQTFGPDVQDFHKTTFQDPPKGGLISEGAAAYRDNDAAHRAFHDLVGLVDGCGATELGPTLVGDWRAEPDSLQTRPAGACGRDYRVKAVVLVEVAFCAFPDSVPEIVMANMLAKVPG
jgi:PknH-like extracellular domain